MARREDGTCLGWCEELPFVIADLVLLEEPLVDRIEDLVDRCTKIFGATEEPQEVFGTLCS